MNYQTETIYAGFWRRLAAFGLTVSCCCCFWSQCAFCLVSWVFLGLLNRPVFFEFTSAQLWVFILQLLYFAAFTGAFGATPGKMILRMKVVSTRLGTLLWRDAIYRETVGRVMNLLLLIGYIIVPFDRQKRTLADRFCDVSAFWRPVNTNPPSAARHKISATPSKRRMGRQPPYGTTVQTPVGARCRAPL